MTSDHTVAAVDIGTNSIKLLIQTNGQRHTESHVVRLGEGVNSTGRLQPAAVERALNALDRVAETIRSAGSVSVGAIATSAVRDAANRSEFLDRASDVLGVRPVVLHGVSEGQLAFLGSCVDLPSGAGAPRLLVDIGEIGRAHV